MDRKPKILAVDDRTENLAALETVLKDLDVILIKATSGNDALKETLHHDFALALLDIQMPDMDGYELAEILREEERTAHLPFIFISAVYTDNLNVFKGYEKGAFSFITKPFQPEILINKVKFFVEKHQQEIALREANESLKHKNAELEMINSELEAFTYSVSHDLRSPLRTINGYAQILQEDYGEKLDGDGQRMIDLIKSGSTKMNSLIDSLLTLSRLGKKEIVKSKINMNLLVKDVMVELKAEMQNKNTRITISELPPAEGDIQLIRQVWINLLSNAIKYSSKKEDPEIVIDGTQENGSVLYSIKDNGVGFDMKYQDQLFGVFKRLHASTQFEGVGIGLAIVKRIVTRHGGRVSASGEIDKGATFTFSLAAVKS
jgi:two-component system, sensor histidine kinase and response regulator